MEAIKLNLTPNLQIEFELLLGQPVSVELLNVCLVDLGMHLNANSVKRDDGDGQGLYIFTSDFDEFVLEFPVRIGIEWAVVRGAAELYHSGVLEMRKSS
jgi:hypothetical protein